MKKNPASEQELLKLIAREVPPPTRGVLTGIGDDCAVISPSLQRGSLLLLKTDAVVEGIHFTPGTPLSSVGWKALCRPLSDIAAMGGVPKYALITVAAPAHWGNTEWRTLYRGIGKAARQFQVSVVGGETVRSPTLHPVLFISVTLTGIVDKKQLRLRSGGRPGDLICVTGKLGGSLKSGRHLRFTPRLLEGQWLAAQKGVTAMMDLSDGLGSDLPKLSRASRCSVQVDFESLPLHRGCSVTEGLTDGEDYELLVTISSDSFPGIQKTWKKNFPDLHLTPIGALLKASAPSPELPAGHDHLASIERTG